MAIVVTARGKDGVTGGSPNTTPTNSNSVNITTPGAGDSIIAVSVTDSTTVTFTWPSGYSEVLSQFSSADGQQHGVAIKDSATGTETNTGTITNSGSAGMIHAVASVSGLHATTKQDVAAQVTNTNTNSAGTLTMTRAITPITDGALILAFMACDTSGNDATTTFTTSAGTTGAWTKLYDINSGFYNIAVGYAIQTTAGALTVQAQSTYTGDSDGSLIVMALRPAAAAGIAFDAAANSGDQAAANSYSGSASWSGSNRFLAVDVSLLGPGTTVTGMTYGGAACTFIGSKATVTSLGSVESWGIAQSAYGAPGAGSNTLALTLSGTIEFSVEWVSYSGVDQIGPTEAYNSAQATNVGAADATVSITTVTDNDWVHGAVVASDTSITANQTTRNNIAGTLGSGANEDNNAAKTPAGAVTMSYTGVGAGATWAIGGYGIRPAGSDLLMGQICT